MAVQTPATAEKPLNNTNSSSLKISRETTYLLKPLHPSGGVDYHMAIEEELSRNVTPETNAAVFMMQAFGPAIIAEEFQQKFFDRLGMKALPPTGAYYVSLAQFANDKGVGEDALNEQLSQLTTEYHSPEGTPLFEWLTVNESALNRLAEATARPHFYEPLLSPTINGRRFLLGTDFPLCKITREASRALVLRSYHKIHKQDFDGAWEDLLACHHLARLIEQKPFALPLLLSASVDSLTHHALKFFVNSRPLGDIDSVQRFHHFKSRLLRIDYLTMLEVERMVLLDAIMLASQNGLPALQQADGGEKNILETASISMFLKSQNWELILKEANRFFDDVDSLHQELPALHAIRELANLQQTLTHWKNDKEMPPHAETNSAIVNILSMREELSKKLAQKIIASSVPSLETQYNALRRQKVRYDLNYLMLALEAYYTNEKQLPQTLNELVPDYLEGLPQPPFAIHQYHYLAHGARGYTISVPTYDVGYPPPMNQPAAISIIRSDIANVDGAISAPANIPPESEQNTQPTEESSSHLFPILVVAVVSLVCLIIGFWFWRRRRG